MALTMAATAATTAAGFLGGHLSYRKGVGVDQTTFEGRFEDWTDAMADADLPDGTPRRVMVAGTNVMLYRTGGRIHALVNRCSHRGGPLHKGTVEEDRVTCPWHVKHLPAPGRCGASGSGHGSTTCLRRAGAGGGHPDPRATRVTVSAPPIATSPVRR